MFFEGLKAVFDALGAVILVPVIIFIIALIMKVPAKKAFMSGLSVGVGLEGFSLLINAYGGVVSPIVQRMVEVIGINLPVFDVGWQAVSMIAYSTEVGMAFIGIGIAVQLIIFALKITNVFQASDLWNNYLYMLYGSMCYVATKNMVLSLCCMLVMMVFVTATAEMMAPRFQNYFGYKGCTYSSLGDTAQAPFGAIANWIMNKFGLYKVHADVNGLQKKLGFFGQPITLGFIVGLVIGISGNVDRIFTLEGINSILMCAIATSAVMVIFPKVSSIFAGAFTPLTEAAKKHSAKRADMIIGVNDAVAYGEPATLITSLILMPLSILIAFILPGNQTLPVINLLAIPYMMSTIVAMCDGNVVKSLIAGLIRVIISLYLCTWTAPLFTQAAVQAGFEITTGTTLVTGFFMIYPIPTLIMYAFISQKPLWITIAVAAVFAYFFLYKKNAGKIHAKIEYEALMGKEEASAVKQA